MRKVPGSIHTNSMVASPGSSTVISARASITPGKSLLTKAVANKVRICFMAVLSS